jgi:hypothetical protein
MSIKKEYVAFSAEGYQYHKTFKDNKPTRVVAIHVRDHASISYLELTIDEAKQVIQDIEKAIKDSKKKGNTPF